MPPPGALGPRGYMTEEEKQSMPKVDIALIKRIGRYLLPYWLQFLFVFIAILVSAVLGLLPSLIMGRIVDEALVGRNLALLLRLTLMAFATMTASQLITVLESTINAWISQRIIYDMKNEMYSHLQGMPHSFFTTEKQGDIITRMNSDINGVNSVISGTLTNVISNAATVITTAVALFSMNWKLALVGIVSIPLLALPTRRVGQTRWKFATESQQKHDEMNEVVNETLSVSGSLLSKLFVREQRDYALFSGLNKQVCDLGMREQRSGQWFRMVMGMFMQVGPLLIYLAGGYLLIQQGDPTMSVGVITATIALINRLYRPVQSLLDLQVQFMRSLALFTRIFDYLDRENPIRNRFNAKKPEIGNQPVQFSHVAFSYSPEKQILKDVNFTVPGGAMYAIVGRSGSGKSTIVNLIPRLYDVCGGNVMIGGTDVRNIDLAYLRGNIGMVTQEAYLFNGTIRDNLLCAKADATEQEMTAACKSANIYDFICNQPDGYETMVGNRGLKLSGGEKQRISLARVILKNPKILIMDEATSALDSISENAIQDALELLMQDRTSIVIAHRLSTVLAAERILVIDGGVIAEAGTHDELLALGGIYQELFETQFHRVLPKDAQQENA